MCCKNTQCFQSCLSNQFVHIALHLQAMQLIHTAEQQKQVKLHSVENIEYINNSESDWAKSIIYIAHNTLSHHCLWGSVTDLLLSWIKKPDPGSISVACFSTMKLHQVTPNLQGQKPWTPEPLTESRIEAQVVVEELLTATLQFSWFKVAMVG
jgi:hypothetical protein